MTVCKYCNKTFSTHPSRTAKGKSTRTVCGSCSVTRRRWKNKIKLVEMLGGKCTKCGYCEHPAALHFHHKNPLEKSYEINSSKLLLKDVDKEVNKCILLCANCHSIQHTNKELLEKFEIL
jgi:5-methylcytosine-specific restriction endonuclease McrA